jgi:hypothetical protein
VVIIKNTIRSILIFAVIIVLITIIAIAYTTYSKAKETEAFYTSTYINAFEQIEITSDMIENVLENKSTITSQETLSQLNDIHESLAQTAEDFALISLRFKSKKTDVNQKFMSVLFELYSDEVNHLQGGLSNNNSKDSFDSAKDVLFIRLALMNSDLQKIMNIDTLHISTYSYDQTKQLWTKMINTLEYVEVTKVYKLKFASLFVKGYFFPYKKN